MSVTIQWLMIILLFFVILPAVAISAITVVRFFYRKIRKKKTIKTTLLVPAILITLIGLAIVPPISYFMTESSMTEITLTGDLAIMTYDKDNSAVRYIEFDGKTYQELDTSISDTEYYDSEDADLEYGKAEANVVTDDRDWLEKYVYAVFKYPIDSQLIYPVENEGMDDFVSLDTTTLFCDVDTIDGRLAYYRDNSNYEYFVEDYNADEYYDISLDNDSINELNKLAYMNAKDSDITKLEMAADYDLFTITGESDDKLVLHEVGQIYIAKDGTMYQFIDEIYKEDDGTVTLYVLPVSAKTTASLTAAFKAAGIL